MMSVLLISYLTVSVVIAAEVFRLNDCSEERGFIGRGAHLALERSNEECFDDAERCVAKALASNNLRDTEACVARRVQCVDAVACEFFQVYEEELVEIVTGSKRKQPGAFFTFSATCAAHQRGRNLNKDQEKQIKSDARRHAAETANRVAGDVGRRGLKNCRCAERALAVLTNERPGRFYVRRASCGVGRLDCGENAESYSTEFRVAIESVVGRCQESARVVDRVRCADVAPCAVADGLGSGLSRFAGHAALKELFLELPEPAVRPPVGTPDFRCDFSLYSRSMSRVASNEAQTLGRALAERIVNELTSDELQICQCAAAALRDTQEGFEEFFELDTCASQRDVFASHFDSSVDSYLDSNVDSEFDLDSDLPDQDFDSALAPNTQGGDTGLGLSNADRVADRNVVEQCALRRSLINSFFIDASTKSRSQCSTSDGAACRSTADCFLLTLAGAAFPQTPIDLDFEEGLIPGCSYTAPTNVATEASKRAAEFVRNVEASLGGIIANCKGPNCPCQCRLAAFGNVRASLPNLIPAFPNPNPFFCAVPEPVV